MLSCLEGEMIIRVVSKNRPGYYWSIDEGIEGYLMQESELFRVINPSLEGSTGSTPGPASSSTTGPTPRRPDH